VESSSVQTAMSSGIEKIALSVHSTEPRKGKYSLFSQLWQVLIALSIMASTHFPLDYDISLDSGRKRKIRKNTTKGWFPKETQTDNVATSSAPAKDFATSSALAESFHASWAPTEDFHASWAPVEDVDASGAPVEDVDASSPTKIQKNAVRKLTPRRRVTHTSLLFYWQDVLLVVTPCRN
jgi:hypothetical protein